MSRGILATSIFIFGSGCQLWQPADELALTSPVASPELDILADRLAGEHWVKNRQWDAITSFEVIGKGETNLPLRWRFRNDPFVDLPTESKSATMPAHVEEEFESPAQSNPDSRVETEEPITNTEVPTDSTGNESSNEMIAIHESAKQPAGGSSDSHPANARWDGFWPLPLHDLVSTLERNNFDRDSSRQQLLRQLAQRPDQVGWNAAIVWGHIDPVEAQAVEPILAKLAGSNRVQTEPEKKTSQIDVATTPPARSIPDRLRGFWQDAAPKEVSEDESITTNVMPSDSTRAAAAEAWVRLLSHQPGEPREQFAPAGCILEGSNLPMGVRVELYLGLARWIPPDQIPRLSNALQQTGDGRRPPVEVRRAALQACLIHALFANDTGKRVLRRNSEDEPEYRAELWPESIANAQYDPDGRVRRLFGQWVVSSDYPEALSVLTSQLDDRDIRVREDAMLSLGRMGTQSARATLVELSRKQEEWVRANALRGLAFWGEDAVAFAVRDKSAEVRRTLAEVLSEYPNMRSALLLRQLLQDRSLPVQSQAVASVNQWPEHDALPLYLHGMQEGVWQTRRQCLEGLRSRTEEEIAFPLDASFSERVAAIRALSRRLQISTIDWQELQTSGIADQTINNDSQADIRYHLNTLQNSPMSSPQRDISIEFLQKLAASDVPAIETCLMETTRPQADSLMYESVLPKLSPAHDALKRLKAADVFQRRRAAQKLAVLSRQGSLSPLVVRRMQQALINEQDQLIWRSAMQAISDDGTKEASGLALLAINHSWADVRLVGCRHFVRHGSPAAATSLIPLFSDRNRKVQIEAIRAAGHCRNPIVVRQRQVKPGATVQHGLESLLNHADRDVRFAVAVAMSQLGDSRGIHEMIRLSYSTDVTQRSRIITEMGNSGQSRFVEHLVQLGWTESNRDVKLQIVRALSQLVPADLQPRNLDTSIPIDDQLEIWTLWQQNRRQGLAGISATFTSH